LLLGSVLASNNPEAIVLDLVQPQPTDRRLRRRMAVQLHPCAFLASNNPEAIVLDLCSHSPPTGGFGVASNVRNASDPADYAINVPILEFSLRVLFRRNLKRNLRLGSAGHKASGPPAPRELDMERRRRGVHHLN
jgi:hypothetical protein